MDLIIPEHGISPSATTLVVSTRARNPLWADFSLKRYKGGSSRNHGTTLPPIRWAGGKRQLSPALISLLPDRFTGYYEPMLGSAALFLATPPHPAILGDINGELVNFYRVLARTPGSLVTRINSVRVTESMFYTLRASRPKSQLGRAVRFFCLIRLCWNGLYRVNRQGAFNTPFGGRLPTELLSRDRALRVAHKLRSAQIMEADYEDSTATASKGDFVFVDPPYPKGAIDGKGFARYSATGFPLSEHRRLAQWVSTLNNRGAFVMLTLGQEQGLVDLYPSNFGRIRIRTASLIAADPTRRKSVHETILLNYRPKYLDDPHCRGIAERTRGLDG